MRGHIEVFTILQERPQPRDIPIVACRGWEALLGVDPPGSPLDGGRAWDARRPAVPLP